jgi:hypothetical protein
VRQRILGAQEATRLATSPVLAAIAKGESAYATRQDLDAFLAGIKPSTPPAAPAPEAPAAPAGDVAPPQAVPPIGLVGTERFVSGSGAIRTAPQIEGIDVALSRGTVGVSPNLLEGLEQSPRTSVKDLLASEAVVLRPPTKEDILDQAPIVGQIYDFRSVAIAERIAEPPSGESRSAAIATKHTTISTVQEIDINVDDIQVPGFRDAQGNQVSRELKDVRGDLLSEILRGVHDPVPADDRNEATFFNASVKALENTVAVLRGVEGRVKAYRNVIARCREVQATVRGHASEAERRLQVIGGEVAEARHDVAVARALMAEEQQRIDGINSRRARILAEHVPFLVYRRPRSVKLVVDTPARAVDAGFVQPPLAACRARSSATPPELQRMVELMRRAPVRWFADVQPLLDRLDQPQILMATLQTARLAALTRASFPAVAVTPAAGGSTALPGAGFATAIGKVLTAQQQSVARNQIAAAALNIGDLAGQSWQNTRDRAREVVTVGDLVEGAHGRSGVAQAAAAAMADIAQVATCLYEAFSTVRPLVRLAWAELLSQYDAPVSLRNLAGLPRWNEVEEAQERRAMQLLVDWLYARVDPHSADAVALIGDLVRICILLASHAPIDQILAGTLQEAITARPGSQIKIAIDPLRVRIGMPVFVYRNEEVVAQAVVTDLIGGIAAAQITQMAQPALPLDKGTRVQFSEALR